MIKTSFRNVTPMMALSAIRWLLGHICVSRHSTGVIHAGLAWVHIIVVLDVYIVIYVIHVLLLTLLHLSLISVFSAIMILRSVHVSLFGSIWCIKIHLGIRSYLISILLLVGDVWKTTLLRVRYLSGLSRCEAQRIGWIRNSLRGAVMESGHARWSCIHLIIRIFTIIRPHYILRVIHPMCTESSLGALPWYIMRIVLWISCSIRITCNISRVWSLSWCSTSVVASFTHLALSFITISRCYFFQALYLACHWIH